MTDENYPSASRIKTVRPEAKATPEPIEKKIKPVVSGTVTRRKKPLGRRLKEMFVGSEDAKGVGSYLLHDVALPAAKDTISDLVTLGLDRMLFGESRHGTHSRRGGGGRVSYGAISTGLARGGTTGAGRPQMSQRARATHDFGEIILETRAEGMEVLSGMYDLLEQFNVVSVADLYELIGEQATFVDRKWGWDALNGSSVIKISGGYLVDLPRPIELD